MNQLARQPFVNDFLSINELPYTLFSDFTDFSDSAGFFSFSPFLNRWYVFWKNENRTISYIVFVTQHQAWLKNK